MSDANPNDAELLDQVFTQLERAREVRSGWVPSIIVAPKFKHLRNDPRFEKLIREMGFPP